MILSFDCSYQHRNREWEADMWRLAALNVAKPGVESKAFVSGWLEELGPAIIEAIRGDNRLRKLIVNLPPESMHPDVAKVFPPRFDGLAEFWFDSAEDAVNVLNDLSTNAHVLAAAEKLIDGDKGVAWLAEVKPWKPETGGTGIKFLAGGDVAEGWTVEDAQRYWHDKHPVLARTVPEMWERLTRYTQFHGHKVSGLELGNWLAVARFVPMCSDMGLETQQSFIDAYTSEPYLRIIRPDEEKFSRPGEMLAFVSGEERELIGGQAV
ncbi:MAG TPA: EthD domain-containing protein [Rhizorhapis sp.]